MQDIDPDIEDLLRRASKAYPLKQGEDKWNDIASRIEQKPPAILIQKQKAKTKKYLTGALLSGLLLLVFLVINQGEKQNQATLQNISKYDADKREDKTNVKIITPGKKVLPLNKEQNIISHIIPSEGKLIAFKYNSAIDHSENQKMNKNKKSDAITLVNNHHEKPSPTKKDIERKEPLPFFADEKELIKTENMNLSKINTQVPAIGKECWCRFFKSTMMKSLPWSEKNLLPAHWSVTKPVYRIQLNS